MTGTTGSTSIALPHVLLASDGSCWPNPGPGGYAAILIYKDGQEKLATGHHTDTTNNRMEMLAVISGLDAVEQPDEVVSPGRWNPKLIIGGWEPDEFGEPFQRIVRVPG